MKFELIATEQNFIFYNLMLSSMQKVTFVARCAPNWGVVSHHAPIISDRRCIEHDVSAVVAQICVSFWAIFLQVSLDDKFYCFAGGSSMSVTFPGRRGEGYVLLSVAGAAVGELQVSLS